jgi:SprA-related family
MLDATQGTSALSTLMSHVKSGDSTKSTTKNATQQQQVQRLQKQDQDVRKHEQAHISAASGVAVSAPTYKYTTGPDGKTYAVSGDVSIDASPGNDPQATLRKADIIRRAALAPAAPSSQDYRVAAQAEQMANKARQEIQQQNSGNSGSIINIQV